LRAAQEASRQKHLSREALAHHPQYLVADVGLQAVYGHYRPSLLPQPLPQPTILRKPERHKLLVAIEEVGHRALRDGDAPPREIPVDLRDAAMLGVAQSANQSYDVQSKLALGQRESAFLLGPLRLTVDLALRVHAATHHQPQTHQPFEGGDGAGVVVSDPQLPLAPSTAITERFEPDLGGGFGTALIPCHRGLLS